MLDVIEFKTKVKPPPSAKRSGGSHPAQAGKSPFGKSVTCFQTKSQQETFAFRVSLILSLGEAVKTSRGRGFFVKKNLILGGVFATHTEMDENGNVIERDEFHVRIYWHLLTSGAIKKLKGGRLHVLITIALHCDNKGEGWPSTKRMAEMLPYSERQIKTFCKELEELGFIERWQTRKENGDFGKMHYRLKAAFPAPADEADQTEEEKSRSAKIAPREKPRSDKDSGAVQKPHRAKSAHARKVHPKEEPSSMKEDNMNGWMGAPRLSIQDVEKSLDEEAKEDPILKALYDGIKFVDITGDENNRVDRAEFAAEFYMVLHKHFRNRIHPEIIRIAFRLYNEKQYSNDGRKSIDYIANPAGWFYQCYDEAIHIYKQIRYARSVEEKNQREDELIRKAIYASRVGYI